MRVDITTGDMIWVIIPHVRRSLLTVLSNITRQNAINQRLYENGSILLRPFIEFINYDLINVIGIYV